MKKDGRIQNAYIVINPASGKAEPILHLLNKGFKKHEVNWDIGVTKEFGDAKRFVKEATQRDYDVIVGYGGDGTQHEIVEGILGTDKLMGILPGGTGNGFAAGLDIPKDTAEAIDMLCQTSNVINVDVAKVNETFFLSRLYTGIDPEDQTSREMKDRYGVFAYAISSVKRRGKMKPIKYRVTVDGKTEERMISKSYIVNSASTGVGIEIGDFSPTDGVLDFFALDDSIESIKSAGDRFLHLQTRLANRYASHGKEFKIETETPQSVWADGEYIGKTPIEVKILEGALKVLADKPKSKRI